MMNLLEIKGERMMEEKRSGELLTPVMLSRESRTELPNLDITLALSWD